MQDRPAFDSDGLDLAGAEECVDYVADAGAGGQWREEYLDLFFGCDDGLAQIERDEGG